MVAGLDARGRFLVQCELRLTAGDDAVTLAVQRARKTVPNCLAEIAWGTEVWVSEAPERLVHVNGDRFLGPHED